MCLFCTYIRTCDPRITIPISIIISILIFGLTKYYTESHVHVTDTQDRNSARTDNPDGDIKSSEEKRKRVPLEKVLSSSSNIIVLIGLTIITLIAIWLLRKLHILTLK
jgi:hypothetical protein